MERIWAFGLFLLLTPILSVAANPVTTRGLPEQKKILVTGRYVTIRYLLYLPRSYHSDGKRRWPLILFLHGSTEKGNDIEIVRRNCLPAYLEQIRSFPFVVISPQLAQDKERWNPAELKSLLDAVLPDIRVDRDKMYLTGWSLGANGVWTMAMSYPDLFAAIAPIAGWGDENRVRLLKDLPVWAFHGAKDANVAPSESSSMVEALRKEGGKARFTLYSDFDHDCWAAVYKDSTLFEWFLQHRRFGPRRHMQGQGRAISPS